MLPLDAFNRREKHIAHTRFLSLFIVSAFAYSRIVRDVPGCSRIVRESDASRPRRCGEFASGVTFQSLPEVHDFNEGLAITFVGPDQSGFLTRGESGGNVGVTQTVLERKQQRLYQSWIPMESAVVVCLLDQPDKQTFAEPIQPIDRDAVSIVP